MCRIIFPTSDGDSSNFRKWTGGDGAGLTYSPKVERPQRIRRNEHLGRSHIPAMSSVSRYGVSQMCWILYTCIEHSVLYGLRSTYIVLCYIHMLNWLYIVDLLQCRTLHLRVFLTPPAKWSPSPPWMGGSCGDLCPTLPGSRLAKGPIIIRIIWGISGLLQEIPAPVRSFTWP